MALQERMENRPIPETVNYLVPKQSQLPSYLPINGGSGVLAPLDRDNRNVLVLVVVAVVEEESFRLLDKLLSCDVFRINQELCLLRGSSNRNGTPQ